jgi:two-component system OmpR family response regulator
VSTGDRILVVDDDPDIRQLLCDYLREAGMRPAAAADGQAMWAWLEHHVADLIVLDLMLPGTDGLALCRALRERTRLPVVMLTARGALIDRIVGLEMGADDYLPKPFDPRELLARIKGVLRRTQEFPPHARAEEAGVLHFNGWQLDTRTRQLTSPAQVLVALGGTDYRVLRELLRHANHTLSRDYLVEHAFDKERSPFDRAIDVCISRLRQHLEEDARSPAVIRTVRNAGYMLTAEVTTRAMAGS